MKERIAHLKVPKDVIVVDELPRNAMGKVQRTCCGKARGIVE